jgi:hypothetical protein
MRAKWRGGLDPAFLRQLERWSGQERLDLVLTAESGSCDRFSKGGSPHVVDGDGALIRGLFRFLSALRDKATVVAIDWEQYESVLESRNKVKGGLP